MDDRAVKKLLVPSFIIVLLSTVLVYELKYVTDQLFFKKKHILIIGILSAPENFQQRLSIRKTWLKLLSEISGSSYFIIGNEICEVPPLDRGDPYTCINKPFTLPANVSADSEFTTIKINPVDIAPKPRTITFTGFGFYVRSSIIVRKLGVLKELLLVLKTDVRVKLVSAIDNSVLASVTFSPDLLGEPSSQLISKAITPVKLDAKFEGYVKFETKSTKNTNYPVCDSATWESTPNVIHFIQLWQEDSVMPQPYNENSCSFVFMNYTIADPASFKAVIQNRTVRLKDWQRFNKKLSVKLQYESKFYNDIMFVDVIDTYRNLSLKMVNFYKRISQSQYFHYVLKTDDDTFIDLPRVHHQLTTISKEIDNEISQTLGENKDPALIAKLRLSRFWWWSYFKEFWKVQRSGKWREDQYQSVSYPTFPCGAGYVINKAVVDYITANENNLHCFQGEDVSLGIWLSPLSVTQYKTSKVISKNTPHHLQKKIITRYKGKRFWTRFAKNLTDEKPNSCEWTCERKQSSNRPLCNKAELSVKNMYDTWTNYINKGFI